MIKLGGPRFMLAVLAVTALGAAGPEPATEGQHTWQVDCDRGGSIGRILEKVQPGQTISVHGVCVENVEIPEGVHRLVLDGNSTAVISAADPSIDTVRIYGDDITVRGFTITGGRDGVNLRGALNIVIEHNTIQANAGSGINVHRVSFALITDNDIRDNGFQGIFLIENASARIGFKESSASQPSPNIIAGNAVHGVFVGRSSNAAIAGNSISGNGRNGVHLEKNAQAEVAFNTIDANGANGVLVTQNSGVSLGNPTGSRWVDLPNTTSVPNNGVGVQCSVGAYAVGRIGTLSGHTGPKSFTADCADGTR